ncbi:MAG: gliding motility lipoprotein GldH [Flavobacteriales bacterium]
MIFRGVVFFVIAGFFSSCGEFPIASDSKEVSPEGWYSDETISFEWSNVDTLKRYSVFVDVRHNQDYPFSNLYLFLDLTFPNGKNRRDTLSCTLADERGNWFGSGIGDVVDHRISFKEDFEFPISGRYNLRITQGMRQDPLKGVLDVGFRLESAVN